MLTVEEFRCRYELLGAIGKGAFGEISAARSATSGDVVAVKISTMVETAREPWLLNLCAHPNVVKLIDYFASPYCTMIAMKRFDCTLHHYMSRYDLKASTALDINIDIAGALCYVHHLHVIHLDLHAKNILLTTKGKCLVACLADFGLAHTTDVQELPGFHVHPEANRAAEIYFANGAALQLSTVPKGGAAPSKGGADPNKGGAGPTRVTTLEYVAPRAIPMQCFGPALDMWAYGCMMYYMQHKLHLFAWEHRRHDGVRPSPRAQTVLNIVSVLGLPPAALCAARSWTIVPQIEKFSAHGSREGGHRFEDVGVPGNLIRQCFTFDPSERITAGDLWKACRCHGAKSSDEM
jgi:serine/threonine protein kinase